MNHVKKMPFKIILLIVIIIILNGCTINKSEAEKGSVTILYSSIQEFNMEYGSFITSHFKDIDINIVEYNSVIGGGIWNNMNMSPRNGGDWNSDAFIDLIHTKQPDILFFPTTLYPELLEEGILKDMTEYSNAYDFSGIDLTMKEALLSMGGGRLYFLSNALVSQAIYYNIDIFEQFGQPLPSDNMKWFDVLNLASHISQLGADEGIAGFSTPNYSKAELLFRIGEDNGIDWYDPINEQVFFSNDSWKDIITQLVKVYRFEKALETNEEPSTQMFLDGNVAMQFFDFKLVDSLNETDHGFEWGVVTAPILLDGSLQSGALSFEYLNGINNASTNIDDARKVWAYLNSELVAKQKHYANYSKLAIPVRSNIITDNKMRNLAAFHKLSPVISIEKIDNRLAAPTESAVKQYIETQLDAIIAGTISIDSAVATWEENILAIIVNSNQ